MTPYRSKLLGGLVAATLLTTAVPLFGREPDPASILDQFEPFAVVELFTSQGCSSCPPADKILQSLTNLSKEQNPQIFTLSFHVDYWNNLGWKDTFSRPDYTQRQRRYTIAFRNRTSYTPQMIINGEHGFGGARYDLAKNFIEEALNKPARIDVKLQAFRQRNSDFVNVNYNVRGEIKNTELNFAIVERDLVVDIKRGENAGRTLHYGNVVRDFTVIPLKERRGVVALKVPNYLNLRKASIIAYVQHSKNMRILGAYKIDL